MDGKIPGREAEGEQTRENVIFDFVESWQC
jgi:hypothetical protein